MILWSLPFTGFITDIKKIDSHQLLVMFVNVASWKTICYACTRDWGGGAGAMADSHLSEASPSPLVAVLSFCKILLQPRA